MEILSQQRMTIIPSKPRVFSLEEVSYHTDISSCWIVIKDRVYDLTNFLNEHPGGSEIMLEHAGMDATTVFQDIGHSVEAQRILSKYYIGELREKDRIYNTKPKL
ncbi:cytochrome b5-like isoform X2 [Oculina patagonica]